MVCTAFGSEPLLVGREPVERAGGQRWLVLLASGELVSVGLGQRSGLERVAGVPVVDRDALYGLGGRLAGMTARARRELVVAWCELVTAAQRLELLAAVMGDGAARRAALIELGELSAVADRG